jgi:DNA-binding MarR family transcriptional regulator
MSDADDAARELGELFPAIYLRLHRRDEKRSELPGASRAVLLHLAQTGPLTVGEAARHLGRAQSVVSEIVDGLEKKGLLDRQRDPEDRRRTLVWLSDVGMNALVREREVLSRELCQRALEAMAPADREKLLSGMRALVRAADAPPKRRSKP